MDLARILTEGSQKLRRLKRKVDRSLKRRSILGTIKFIIFNLGSVVTALTSSRTSGRSVPSEYDRKFNVDTSGQIHLSDLDIESPNSAFGNSYEPSPPKIIIEMISGLGIRYEDYTFIDIGSGKGLVLLIASTYPFRKIVGVEFSSELHAIAIQNLRNYTNPEQKCKNIELVLKDATEYVIPNDPIVLYMFNPFNEKILRTVVTKIRESIRISPRPVFILYKNPTARRIFEADNLVKTTRVCREYAIYNFQGT
jgi:hypothetical protein